MGHSYQETYRIPFEMVDVNGNIKLPDFLAKLLDVSGTHSNALGRSDQYVRETYGYVWIVTDYEFTIEQMPRLNQELLIRTEAVSYNKLICHRCFEVLDHSDRVLMTVEAYFALMDLTSRRVVAVPEELIGPYLSEKVKKISRNASYKTLDHPETKSYAIRFFDIDHNGHVNNSKYFEWIYESLDYHFLLNHVPKHIYLKYAREVSPGGTIDSQYELDEMVSHHQIVSDGQISTQARIEWEVRS